MRTHGTAATYASGKCRCDDCRTAWAVACSARKIEREARLPFNSRVVHGKPSTYGNHRCRCEACTAAHRIATAARRARQKGTQDVG